jgi:hypothetical protein
VPGIFDLLAMDGFGIIGTVGFFVPAALLIVIVVGAVVRDRRLAAREAAAEAYETGLEKMPAKPTTDSAKAMESRGGQRGSMRRR